MKKIIVLIALMLITFSVYGMVVSANEQDVGVYVNGEKLIFDVNPVIENGRTLVPIRAISESLKYDVTWNNDTNEAVITDGEDVMTISIGKKEYTKNGTMKEMDVPAQLINGRTLVPLRLIAESFGCNVSWDNDTFSAYIETQFDNEISVVEKEWLPDFSDYSTGSINSPFCANLIYIGEDVKKPAGYNFEFEYLEYQPSNEDETKKLKIKSIKTIDDEVALKFLKNEVKGVDYDSLKPADGQTWWIHKIIIEYIDGTNMLNINELINEDNLYLKTGERYETIDSFIVYEKKVYKDSVLELEKSKDSYVIYLCTLINKSSKNPLLRIRYNNGEKAKYFHLNSYRTKTVEEQLGVKDKYPTPNNSNKVENSSNTSNHSNTTITDLRNERARLVKELNSALASNMGRDSSYTRTLRDRISAIDREISNLQ